MRNFLINVPSRRYDLILSVGLFYVAGIIDKISHQVKIFDLYLEDAYLEFFIPNLIDEEVGSFNLNIISYGGTVTS